MCFASWLFVTMQVRIVQKQQKTTTTTRDALMTAMSASTNLQLIHSSQKVQHQHKNDCALLFFGLPRAYTTLVLPSLRRNVLQRNPHCDVYLHTYRLQEETAGRSGAGGTLRVEEAVQALRDTVQQVYKESSSSRYYKGGRPPPLVRFVADTEEVFWDQYRPLLNKLRNTTLAGGNFLYFPYKATTYRYPTTLDNIIKMWHSLQRVYELTAGRTYRRMAVLRSDVLYLTPIDLDRIPDLSTQASSSSVAHLKPYQYAEDVLPFKDTVDNTLVIPAFGRHPISDRLLIGPQESVRQYCTTRFDRLEEHAHYMQQHQPGWGLHSERFVARLLDNVTATMGYTLLEHPTLCFLRSRADESVWMSDCHPRVSAPSLAVVTFGRTTPREWIEFVLHRSCAAETQLNPSVRSLDCSNSNDNSTEKFS